jgi:hypothetical protein
VVVLEVVQDFVWRRQGWQQQPQQPLVVGLAAGLCQAEQD